MVIVKNQVVNKKNQRELKKGKKVMQVKQEEDNDNENLAMAVSEEKEDGSDFESDKDEYKEHDLDLKEDEDSDEGFLEEKLSNLKKKANKLKVNKEKKEQTKLNKAKRKKEGNIQNNENQALIKVTKQDVKSNKNPKEITKKSQNKKDTRSLYIGKLPDGVKIQDLKDLSKDIVEVHIPKRDGSNLRCAFIRFQNKAAAEANLNILKTKIFKGQPLTVDYAGSKNNGKLEKVVASGETKDHTGESQEKKDARSLYIGKLPNGVTKQDLKDLSKDIVEIYIQKKTDGPNSRFAYIRFDDEATAERNYSILKRMKIKDQPLTVDYVGSKSSYGDVNLRKERNARKLYVGDLPGDITEKELKKLSDDIVEIFIAAGKKKFAFLIFDSEDKAKSNYEVLKDKKIRGQPIVVNFKQSRDSITKTGKRSQDDDLHDGQRSAKKIRR